MFSSSYYFTNGIFNETREYFSTDTGVAPRLNPEWTEPFTYTFNSLGFRSKEPVPGEECVVTFGCSYTVGVGIPQEKRFGDIVARNLNLAHYDFAVEGADMIQVAHNFSTFFDKEFHQLNPKHILILWPDIARFSWLGADDRNIPLIVREVPATVDDNSWQGQFMAQWGNNVSIVYLMQCIRFVEMLCRKYNIKLLQQCVNNVFVGTNLDSWKYCPDALNPAWNNTMYWDNSRDYHFGPISHEKIANSFLKFTK